jgi:2-polyprenyl-3-methyl-5-hydroxy-6-metoxy-1,4-benzoquinol methylase
MLDSEGFDLWANHYDESVGLSDEDGTYPFAGYKEVLNKIYNCVIHASYKDILDVGFGTATLTSKLYEHGCKIYGQDFSEEMIDIAKKKMPTAMLFKGDLAKGLVEPLLQNKYDAILATYSLHHLTDMQKVILIKSLLAHLNEAGCLCIGDIAFATRESHNACRKEVGDLWDNNEIYFIADELRAYFPSMQYEQISSCAGLITLRKANG